MAEQAIHEMVAAYAVGCMDKQNFVQFKDYMAEGGDLPEGELGELQNVVSMIPVILDLEKPHDAIKDMVATKLIGMKEEIKAKILNDRKTLVNTFTNGPTIASIPDSSVTKPVASTRIIPKFNTVNLKTEGSEATSTLDFSKDDFESSLGEIDLFKNTKTRIPTIAAESAVMTNIESTKIKSDETKPVVSSKPVETPAAEEQKAASNWIQILGIIFTILICTILGYYTFISTQKLESSIDEMQVELKSIKSQLATANNFVGSNASLVEFLNYKDINVINMLGRDAANKASVKILLSFDEKEGLLQFKNCPQLLAEQVFQLWFVSKGQSYPSGTYKPISNEYVRISPFPFLPKEQIESYLITIESVNGASTPSANLVAVSESLSGKNSR